MDSSPISTDSEELDSFEVLAKLRNHNDNHDKPDEGEEPESETSNRGLDKSQSEKEADQMITSKTMTKSMSSPLSITTGALQSLTAAYDDEDKEGKNGIDNDNNDDNQSTTSSEDHEDEGTGEILMKMIHAQKTNLENLLQGCRNQQEKMMSQMGKMRQSYVRPHLLILLGFTISFVFFFLHTLIHHWSLQQQHSVLTNLTQAERQERLMQSEKFDNLREHMMHREYEEARFKSEELQICRKEVDNLKVTLRTLEDKMETKDATLGEMKGSTETKMMELRRLVQLLKEKNERLVDDKKHASFWGICIGGFIMGIVTYLTKGSGVKG